MKNPRGVSQKSMAAAKKESGKKCLIAAVLWATALTMATLGPASAQYQAYRANLHVHTNVSGSDHNLARTPLGTVERSNAVGLDVLGLSDHAGAIQSSDWSYLSWLSDETTRDPGQYVVGIRGFEWTYCGEPLTPSTYDHINVFGTSQYWEANSSNSVTDELSTMYQRLASAYANDREFDGRPPVAQFNHIWMGTNFNDFAYNQQADQVINLAEIGGAEFFYHSASASENLFRTALQRGWHVGPTIGEDNTTPLDSGAVNRHTGVWASSCTRGSIIDALSARRVFATEHNDFRLTFQAATGSTGVWHWMGDVVPIDTGDSVDFGIIVDDPCGGDPAQYVSIISMYGDPLSTQPGTLNGFTHSLHLTWSQLWQISMTELGEWCFFVQVVHRSGAYSYSSPIWLTPRTLLVFTPRFSPGGGRYDSPQCVSMSCATPGAAIHYTTDGSAPTCASAVYTGCVTVNPGTTLKAIACKGDNSSLVISADYILPKVVYVKPTGSDSDSGLSWGLAKRTVQAGLNIAFKDDEVWVAAGIYHEHITTGNHAALYGGFAGTEARLGERSPKTNTTILDGDNAGVVVTVMDGEDENTIIDGFTVRNGHLLTNYDHPGGGIYIPNGSPTISNNVITGNAVSGGFPYGAAIFCGYGSPVIARNTISGNSGPALYCGGQPSVLSNMFTESDSRYYYAIQCNGGIISGNTLDAGIMANGTTSIVGNTIRNSGGPGVRCWYSASTVTDNIITGCHGGVISHNGCTKIANNTIEDNHDSFDSDGGAGIYCSGSSTDISNNRIIGNGDDSIGGGICAYGPAIISNNLIMGNQAQQGGGIYCSEYAYPGPQVFNNTIVANSAEQGGGVSCCYHTYSQSQDQLPGFTNNIVANNTSGIFVHDGSYTPTGAYPTLDNNCVYNNAFYNYSGMPDPTGVDGNISLDPLFALSKTGNVHIQPASPCRDSGDDSEVPAGWVDLDSRPRIIGAHVDIGAYESDGTTFSTVPDTVRVSLSGNDGNDGSSWTFAKRTVKAAVDAASANGGGEVWVQSGIYNESVNVPRFVHVLGGFDDKSFSTSDRNWTLNLSVIDGSGLPYGSPPVMFEQTGYLLSSLDGLSVTNGTGGGIVCSTGSPLLANNTVSNNCHVGFRNGGITCYDSFAYITGNSITDNHIYGGDEGGGGIGCVGGTPVVSWNTITANSAPHGGAILGGSAYIFNNVIDSNSSSTYHYSGAVEGGQLVCNNIIVHNSGGSALRADASRICCNTIVENVGENAVIAYGPGTAQMADNIVAFNKSGIRMQGMPGLTLRNNCVYGNTDGNYLGISPGTQDFSCDPLFVEGYHLSPASPCIERGDNTLIMPDWLDMDGMPRLNCEYVDVGAYEYRGACAPSVPLFSQEGGVYNSPQLVSVTCRTSGAVVHYTENGEDPSEADPVVSGPITVDRNMTLRARAFKDGLNPSAVRSATFILKVLTPVFSPGGGTYNSAQSVTAGCATPGAVVHYTANGIDPTETDPVVSGPITVDGNTTLKSRAFVSGWIASDIARADYVIHRGISGHVRKEDGSGVSGVYVYTDWDGSWSAYSVTDADGYYSIGVPPGWSGTISADGWGVPCVCIPESRTYTNIATDLPDQDFVAVPGAFVSGHVRKLDGTPITGVRISAVGAGTSQGVDDHDYTWNDGYYELLVPVGWAGDIATSWGDYLTPASRTYDNVSSDMADQDFSCAATQTLSGYVRNADGTADYWATVSSSDEVVNGWPDGYGFYSVLVPHGWGGDVSVYDENDPSAVFDPTHRVYTSVTTDMTDQSYQKVGQIAISGYVLDADGKGIKGADICSPGGPIGGPSLAVTDKNGYYRLQVTGGWSGELTVITSDFGALFSPPKRAYENVTSCQYDQGYRRIPCFHISGSIVGAGDGYIRVYGDNGAGEAYPWGNSYSLAVPVGWSGTVAVESPFYTFSPPSRAYTDVQSDLAEQDYSAEVSGNRISEIKQFADGTEVVSLPAVFSAVYPDFSYIESEDRECGIKIACPAMSSGAGWTATWCYPGSVAAVHGTVRTDSSGERYIDVLPYLDPTGWWGSLLAFAYDWESSASITPLCMTNRALGGGSFFWDDSAGTGQRGITGAFGLNNIGLLVKTYGKYTYVDQHTFTIDDGSTGGVKCITPSDVTVDPAWIFVTVTGISSCEKPGGELRRLIRVRTRNDIVSF